MIPSPIYGISLVPLAKRVFERIRDPIEALYEAGAFAQGRHVDLLEHAFQEHVGKRHAIACNSGTSALHLACLLHSLSRRDNVIVPANSFIATALAPLYCGAEVRLADVEPDTLNVSRQTIEPLIDSNTKAVFVVDFAGIPCDWDDLERISVRVILDGAHSHGCSFRGQPTLGYAEVSTTSFFPSKVFGGNGEGGMIFVDHDEDAVKLKAWRQFGETEKHVHDLMGFNYKMNELTALHLLAVLALKEWILEERAKVAATYDACIEFEKVGLRQIAPHRFATRNHYLYVVRTIDAATCARLKMHLRAHDIRITESTYKRTINRHKAWPYQPDRYNVKNAESAVASLVCLPIWPGMLAEEVERVVAAVNSFQS